MFTAIKHFLTITRHRHLVMRYCFKCGLYKQGLLHDLSKYSFAEFVPSVKNYANGTSSPNGKERLKNGYSSAWLHHKGRNKHHCEYWFDFNNEYGKYMPVEMPDRYIAESICDRIAASKNYNRKTYTPQFALDYFLYEKDKLVIHPNSAKKLEELLKLYVDKGQKYLFKYIKKNMRGKH